MATPNYEQIQSFGNVSKQLQEAAIDEFMEYVYEGMSIDELIDAATNVAMKYSYLGCELGAQWYDLCSELAGLDVEAAYLPEVDESQVAAKARSVIEGATETSLIGDTVNYFLQNEINNSIRLTGSSNLWRDYERGKAGGRWARVPVGDTCAWCLMLASQGAWYLSEETAIGTNPGHFHDGCNCIAVYHADAESIAGYSELDRYKSMYYEADNLRRANASTSKDYSYPEELQQRIIDAKERHRKLEEKKALEAAERGEEYNETKWTVYNEDLIVMRYKYGLK